MRLGPGKKSSGSGIVPEDWEEGVLEDYTSFISYGFTNPMPTTDAGPFMITAADVSDGRILFESARHTSEEAFSKRLTAKSRPIKNDVLLTKDGALGRVALVGEEEICINQSVAILRPNERVEPDFLARLLQADQYQAKMLEDAGGTTIKHIYITVVNRMAVALPSSKDEQRKIVEALSDIDALIGSLSRLVVKKRGLRIGAMQRLLTGEMRLPGFSIPWKERRLGDHVSFLKNGVQSRAQLTLNDPVRYLHYGDIHVAQNLRLNIREAEMPRLPKAEAARLSRLEDGDLVFVDASEDLVGVGKSLEITGAESIEAVAGQHTIAARFDKDVLADGFKGYLQHIPAFTTHLRRLAAGTKVYATNHKHIASAEILLPEPEEQRAIVRVLSDMDDEITALEARLDKTRALKQGMMQVLLTGRVRLPVQAEASDVLEVAHA